VDPRDRQLVSLTIDPRSLVRIVPETAPLLGELRVETLRLEGLPP
jgi:hypothetical protein